jgi:hypothetical protein
VHAAGQSSWLRRSSYAGLRGTRFRAQAAGTTRSFWLTLRSVSDLPAATSVAALRNHDDAFVLSFDGPGPVTEGAHQLRHPSLGIFTAFLTSAASSDGTAQVAAVVNRVPA